MFSDGFPFESKARCPCCGASAENNYQHAASCPTNQDARPNGRLLERLMALHNLPPDEEDDELASKGSTWFGG